MEKEIRLFKMGDIESETVLANKVYPQVTIFSRNVVSDKCVEVYFKGEDTNLYLLTFDPKNLQTSQVISLFESPTGDSISEVSFCPARREALVHLFASENKVFILAMEKDRPALQKIKEV